MHVWFFCGYNYDVMIKDVMILDISRSLVLTHTHSKRTVLTLKSRRVVCVFVCISVKSRWKMCVCVIVRTDLWQKKSNNYRFLASDISRLAIILPLQMLVPASERSSYIVDSWRWCFDVVVWLWQWCKCCCCYYSFSSLLSTTLNCCCCCLLLHGFIKEYI